MNMIELCFLACIEAGGDFFSVLQVYLMSSVKGYRHVFILPVIFCCIACSNNMDHGYEMKKEGTL